MLINYWACMIVMDRYRNDYWYYLLLYTKYVPHDMLTAKSRTWREPKKAKLWDATVDCCILLLVIGLHPQWGFIHVVVRMIDDLTVYPGSFYTLYIRSPDTVNSTLSLALSLPVCLTVSLKWVQFDCAPDFPRTGPFPMCSANIYYTAQYRIISKRQKSRRSTRTF